MSRRQLSGNISRQRGFTLFEMVIVILLIGLMMIVAIDRMLQLHIGAERVSVQQVIGAVRGAVNLQAAELVVEKGLDSIRTLENTNPMQYLSELPYNYLGIHNDNDAAEKPPGSWYFDPEQNILVYTVVNTNYFETSLQGTPRIRLQVELIYKDETRRGRYGLVRGITVNSIDAYHWKYNE